MKQLFSIITLLFSLSLSAQTADDIVNLNIEAMGGKAKLSSLNTVKMTGSMSSRGMDIPMSISKLQMKGIRLDLELMGSSYYQVLNTTSGWMLMPGMQEPKEMPADTYNTTFNQSDIQGSLFDYKSKGNTVDYLGKEKADSGESYKLKVTYKNGKNALYFIDTKTNRLVKTSAKVSFNGQEMDAETSFGDYKQTKDGYWFPYSITNRQGVIVIDSIDANVPLDEKLFTN